MRNLSVLIQEFVSRDGSMADGFLLVNETRVDQRLAVWTKNCSEQEENKMKMEFLQGWKWVYAVYTGDCLRQEMANTCGEQDIEVSSKDQCCTSCDLNKPLDFNVKRPFSLILQAVEDLRKVSIFKDGIKEAVLIDWLRGSTKDVFCFNLVLEVIDETQTYGAGSRYLDVNCSYKWWARILRQAVSLEYMDIEFVITRCQSFTKVWRRYILSRKGKQFLEVRIDILVVNPSHDPLDGPSLKTTKAARERAGRGHHHLPKIRKALSSSRKWAELTTEDQYQFLVSGKNKAATLQITEL